MSTAATKRGSMRERLSTFAATNVRKKGPPCTACILPGEVLALIREARRAGEAFSTLAGFLRAEGYSVRDFTLGKHFREHEQR